MEAGNWDQIKEILELAIEQPRDRREQFIEERCSGDAVLRSKVDSLINSYERVGSFMEDEAIGNVAEMFTSPKNSLEPGDLLGHYRIVKVLGEGGMGKVYLADDVDLHRQVAIKVLRDDLWWYKQARQRLLREARAAARLDHPNICAIFEIEDTEERSFIVMQYVEGDTLGHIMANGGLGARESLRIALQIAGALEEAHSHHIIHRDIKPANIIVNERRQAKVLDFGLAKSIEPHKGKPENDISSSGAVMGTVPYMSPEQLRGKTVDGRSDVFSFGALLYEMLSGRQVFGRDSNAETISAILNDEPDLSLIPVKLRTLIGRSLEKKAGDRYQTISELATELREIELDAADDTAPQQSFSNWFGAKSVISTAYHRYFSGGTGRKRSAQRSYYKWQDSDSDARTVRLTETVAPSLITEPRGIRFYQRPILNIVLAMVVLAGGGTAFWWSIRKPADSHNFDLIRPIRLVEWKEAASDVYLGYSSSHNGKMIAYSASKNGVGRSIFVKQIANSADVQATKDQWNNYSPIWSPDDQQLAFISVRDGSLGIYSSPFLGGETTLVKTLDLGSLSLRHWSNDGSIIYYEFNGNLFGLDLASKESRQMTSFESSESAEHDFSFSPDESQLVYCDVVGGQTDLWTMHVSGGAATRLTNDLEAENHPFWHPDGNRIVYSVKRDDRDQINILYLDRRASEQVTRGEGEHQLVDVSADGARIFYTTWESRSDVWSINTESRQESQVTTGKESEFWPDVSPDGKSILYQTNSAVDAESFLSTNSSFTVTSLGEAGSPKVVPGYDPRWLPDGRHIAFLRWQGTDKGNSLWTIDTVTGEEIRVVDERAGVSTFATLPYNRFQVKDYNWSPVGNEFVYISARPGQSNVIRKTTDGSEPVSLSNNSDSSIKYYCPIFSPEGIQVAYVSVQRPVGQKPTTKVWIARGGDSREIYSTTDGLRLLGWTGNDNLILELTDRQLNADPIDARLLRISLSDPPQLIATLEKAYIPSATLSGDGKTIAFTARQNEMDDIFIIKSDGHTVRKITSNNDSRLYYGSLAWSPDGKNIFFDKQEKISTISMFENLR